MLRRSTLRFFCSSLLYSLWLLQCSKKCCTVSGASQWEHFPFTCFFSLNKVSFNRQLPTLSLCMIFSSRLQRKLLLNVGLMVGWRWNRKRPLCELTQACCHISIWWLDILLLISLLLCAISFSFSCFSASFAKPSTISFPKIPQCDGIHSKKTSKCCFFGIYTKDVLYISFERQDWFSSCRSHNTLRESQKITDFSSLLSLIHSRAMIIATCSALNMEIGLIFFAILVLYIWVYIYTAEL